MRIFIIVIRFFSLPLYAQYTISEIEFLKIGSEEPMQFPLTGGFNSPQFSEIDMSQDGKNDLFVFDRSGNSFFILKNVTEDGSSEPFYEYSIDYDNGIPLLKDWALMYDYNCDGLPDIFTYLSGSSAVYTAKAESGTIVFELFQEEMVYQSTIEIPIYVSRVDLPGLADIDSDGDMDVVAFSVSGTVMRLFENQSQDMGYGCDSLIFLKTDDCWGDIIETATCDGADVSLGCFTDGGSADDERMHVGSTILPFDFDKDGDKDVLLGDVSCNNMVLYINGGNSSFADMVEKDSLFPKYDLPIKISEFPGAYLVDMNFDGNKDLLVAPNDDFFSVNYNNVLWYENVIADPMEADSFEYQGNNFFSSNTVDAGDFSKPIFFDSNNDQLLDILIGRGSKKQPVSEPFYGLELWVNIGNEETPVYEMQDDDYLDLAEYNLRDLSPCFGDVDNDGDEDLFLGNFDGSITFLENTAGPMEVPVFNPPVFFVDDIDVGQNAAPFLSDVDEDGQLDLIVGEENGSLNYFKNNSGTFELITESWGGVDVRTPGDVVGYSVPFVFEEENLLLVGSVSGKVFSYNLVGDGLSEPFVLLDSAFLNINKGKFSTIYGAQIDSNPKTEWLIGNICGGISIINEANPVGILNQPKNEIHEIQLFPNPAGSNLYLKDLELGGELSCYSADGRLMGTWGVGSASMELDIRSWPSGLYYLKLSSHSGISQAIVVKQ